MDIIENINITTARDQRPSFVHSSDAAAASIRTTAAEQIHPQGSYKLHFQCGKMVSDFLQL